MGNSNSSDNSNSSSVQLNPMIQYEQQQKIFDTVAEGFKNEITLVKNKMARNDPPFSRRLENEASYCCNESEKTILLDFAIKIIYILWISLERGCLLFQYKTRKKRSLG